jgi:cytochrome c peroxidase
MSLNALRAPVRRAVFSAPFAKAQLRTSFRRYSSGPSPAPKSNLGLFAGLGFVAIGGIGLYLYNSDTASWNPASAQKPGQASNVKAKFTPQQGDYQKVRSVNDITWPSTHHR